MKDGSSAAWEVRLGDGGNGERVFAKPLEFTGVVFFTTFIPDNGDCGGGGYT